MSRPRPNLSACLIVRDEEERLPAALASVSFCDEVVVVDSGSTDGTVAIARAAGATVVENPWPGFAAQRNVALDHARGEWILEIDADERVSPALGEEIRAFLAGPPPAEVDMAALPLRDAFLGRRLGPSSKYPKYRYRLFRRGAYRHDERRTVHEGLRTARPVAAMSGDLEHLLAESWAEAIRDAWRYAALDARQSGAGRSGTAALRSVLLRPPLKLVYRTVVDGGWRDGWQGLAKIALDCATDVAVGVRVALGQGGGGSPPPEPPREGPVRLVAVASGDAATRSATTWLGAARTAGADTALLTDRPGPPAGPDHHVRPLARPGPIALLRALDAEGQLRSVDALVPFGRRARVAVRLLPRRFHGPGGRRDPGSGSRAPAETVEAVRRDTRVLRLPAVPSSGPATE